MEEEGATSGRGKDVPSSRSEKAESGHDSEPQGGIQLTEERRGCPDCSERQARARGRSRKRNRRGAAALSPESSASEGEERRRTRKGERRRGEKTRRGHPDAVVISDEEEDEQLQLALALSASMQDSCEGAPNLTADRARDAVDIGDAEGVESTGVAGTERRCKGADITDAERSASASCSGEPCRGDVLGKLHDPRLPAESDGSAAHIEGEADEVDEEPGWDWRRRRGEEEARRRRESRAEKGKKENICSRGEALSDDGRCVQTARGERRRDKESRETPLKSRQSSSKIAAESGDRQTDRLSNGSEGALLMKTDFSNDLKMLEQEVEDDENEDLQLALALSMSEQHDAYNECREQFHTASSSDKNAEATSCALLQSASSSASSGAPRNAHGSAGRDVSHRTEFFHSSSSSSAAAPARRFSPKGEPAEASLSAGSSPKNTEVCAFGGLSHRGATKGNDEAHSSAVVSSAGSASALANQKKISGESDDGGFSAGEARLQRVRGEEAEIGDEQEGRADRTRGLRSPEETVTETAESKQRQERLMGEASTEGGDLLRKCSTNNVGIRGKPVTEGKGDETNVQAQRGGIPPRALQLSACDDGVMFISSPSPSDAADSDFEPESGRRKRKRRAKKRNGEDGVGGKENQASSEEVSDSPCSSLEQESFSSSPASSDLEPERRATKGRRRKRGGRTASRPSAKSSGSRRTQTGNCVKKGEARDGRESAMTVSAAQPVCRGESGADESTRGSQRDRHETREVVRQKKALLKSQQRAVEREAASTAVRLWKREKLQDACVYIWQVLTRAVASPASSSSFGENGDERGGRATGGRGRVRDRPGGGKLAELLQQAQREEQAKLQPSRPPSSAAVGTSVSEGAQEMEGSSAGNGNRCAAPLPSSTVSERSHRHLADDEAARRAVDGRQASQRASPQSSKGGDSCAAYAKPFVTVSDIAEVARAISLALSDDEIQHMISLAAREGSPVLSTEESHINDARGRGRKRDDDAERAHARKMKTLALYTGSKAFLAYDEFERFFHRSLGLKVEKNGKVW
ncbi:ubiquitin interaction motif domain-containing protein [Besnoitia besnoiti]|uniref:Ubiquitin interaction motif domain-containing protein n=1 Tax=Besnoitia besnoiti TaxID=94643 RepID=A0A2A9MPK8_BESBE|nr:ubiquitin interaction motif domain-containing protein [Besnoitia besnoiti]PFH37752.1 ubiquitin interaction motif domain-containing protein [Besnoitia besnoiti]